MSALEMEPLRDLARNPTAKPYVREAAAEVLAAAEAAERKREAKMRHWCTRCRRPVTAEEPAAGIRAYGKPYCAHCLEEHLFEDLNFEADFEKAKRLRTVDRVAVQSQGERRIGDWLASHRVTYRYDERICLAGLAWRYVFARGFRDGRRRNLFQFIREGVTAAVCEENIRQGWVKRHKIYRNHLAPRNPTAR